MEIGNVIIVTDADLSRSDGYTIRVLALASELGKRDIIVDLVAPTPANSNIAIALGNNVAVHYVPIRRRPGSVLNLAGRILLLVREVKKLGTKQAALCIESSPLGGYFAMNGFSNYIVDVHGICFDEVNYEKFPWYIPRLFLRRYMHFLEGLAVNRASKVTVVSESMKQFIETEWKIPPEKVAIIPNGYFESKIEKFRHINVKRGMVSFVGALAEWAAVDRVIAAAKRLRDTEATFYIVGDGEFRSELEYMVRQYCLTNVIFTGFVTIDKAYEIMAQSEICLCPFPNYLCTHVACPIKVNEYLALGKTMVIDEVSDLAKFLKENDAALVCDPDSEEEFSENIRMLLNDANLRNRLSFNAKKLAHDFTWEKQAAKLASVLGL